MKVLGLAALAAAVLGGRPEPPEIAAYYRDYNLAMAFSTRLERQQLVESRVAPGSERLRRVARWLERLDEKVADHDPGIARRVRGAAPLAYRADLLRVLAIEADAESGTAIVELEALSIEPPASALFVSRYDELAAGGKEPSLDRLLDVARGPMVVSRERHLWRRHGDTWRLAPATHHFLK